MKGNEKGKTLVQWRGYTINKDTQITDSQAIEYSFRNLGDVDITINNIVLKGSATGNGGTFNESLNTDEISYGDYEIKFATSGGRKPLLNIAIKSYVGTQINKK